MSVFVVESHWVSDSLGDLMALGDQQGRRPGDLDGDAATISGIERGDDHFGVIYQGRFETSCPPSGPLVMRWNACTARLPTTGACELFGHHEIDRDAGSIDPASRLSICRREKPGPSHCRLDLRVIREPTGIQCDVTILCRFRKGDVNTAGPQVNSLSTNNDE
ncbi:hypothetical protein [Nocardia seriolae]|uniref:hypothetical protein n=1 Tax=Nocardia seriolae TaxID=37332 RepID=UPI0011607510|nr:hypothetical protein [Nocardia seriolae]MTJ61098.1 hypothetical protein [Nocardia seriolae]QOW31276.1 hypothetical protein IMZ23_24615 [Nocardia seriolae]WNJ58299.1 hypothetical protein RMO66_33850 [Nocardia seriolae]BEK90997.1 hypothetical protein NSERKGN1266_69480 [Nocardia seriolae]BEK93282.1 hypothetical protein NSER024013_11880 [Nocardia seriolae]